jgi:hypothetical protein
MEELKKILKHDVSVDLEELDNFLPVKDWSKPQFDFNEDSHALIERAE